MLFICHHNATANIYTLSLHDALPICLKNISPQKRVRDNLIWPAPLTVRALGILYRGAFSKPRGRWSGVCRRSFRRCTQDRKSTRLNSSHLVISYAVFFLKKKTDDDES